MRKKSKKKKSKIRKKKKSKKKELLFILIILLIGFSLRLFLTTCYYWDELIYLQHAEILDGKIDNYSEFDFRPPLLSVLIAGLYLLWHNPVIANILVSLLSAFSILFIYLVAKEMFDKKTGVLAAVLLAFWPIHIYFSKSLLVHTTAMFFALASLFFLKKAENNDKALLFFISGIFVGLSVLTRFTYLILIPLFVINIVVFRKKYNFNKIIFGIIGLSLVLLPYLIWSYNTYSAPLHTFKMASLVVSWSTKQPWHFYFTNFWPLLSLTGIFGLFSWIFFKVKNKKLGKQEIFLLMWLLIPLVYLSLMSHKEVRFLMAILIPIVLLSSVGFRECFKKIKKIRLAKIAVLILFIIVLTSLFSFTYNPYHRVCDSDAQRASEWIMQNTNDEDIIYAQEQFTALAYYTDRKIMLAPFNRTRFFDLDADYMNVSGYYIYFERQNENEMFPRIEEIEQDPRFKLIGVIENREKIYVYKYL